MDRRFTRKDENSGQTADFIGCIAFGKGAEFAEKYLHQGTKVLVTGWIQTGSYTNREGQKVYTTDIVVEDQEFAESKATDTSGKNREIAPDSQGRKKPVVDESGFMKIPEGYDDEIFLRVRRGGHSTNYTFKERTL